MANEQGGNIVYGIEEDSSRGYRRAKSVRRRFLARVLRTVEIWRSNVNDVQRSDDQCVVFEPSPLSGPGHSETEGEYGGTPRQLRALRHTGTVLTKSTPTGPTSPVPAGLLGWKKASCLGCARRVVQTRDSWVAIGGTRTGSYLLTWGAEPLLAGVTHSDPPNEPLFLLGVAHRDCVHAARARLETGASTLLEDLPTLQIDLGVSLPEAPYMLHMTTQPDACAFCDSATELTREHVWPAWYSKELQARGATPIGDKVRAGRIEVTVPVCRTCNNTWMSVLENDTRPLLVRMMNAGAGGSLGTGLTPSQQTLLATWAGKTAYLVDAYQQPAVPRGFLHQLALQRTPNESTIVWIAAYTPDIAVRSEKHALHLIARTGPSRNSPDGFVVTFTVFNVLFQVVGHFSGGPAEIRDDRRQYEMALFRIWPRSGTDLTWPPAVGFSRTSWDDLAASITDGRTNTGTSSGN